MIEKIERAITAFKTEIEKLYGPRLKKVIVYGSWARGEATDRSDVDLTVVLEGMVSPGKEIDRMVDIITEINLNYNTLIAVYPISENSFSMPQNPLVRNIHKDGIVV